MTQRNTEARARRKRQAALSALVNGAALLLGAAVTLWARARCPAGPLSVCLLVLAVGLAAMLLPLAVSLRQRLKEIERGEEDEASQY